MSILKSGRPAKFNPFAGIGSKPPHKPGIYRIRDQSGAIAYIGETSDLKVRMRQHMKCGKLAQLGGGTFEFQQADGRSTSKTRREVERRQINKHNPFLNLSHGGEGRPAKK